MYPHRIRLRGPWEVRTPGQTAGDTLQIAQMPSAWQDLECGPDAIFTRRFGLPRSLADYESVWLVCDGPDPTAEFILNGKPLGGVAAPCAFDITQHLRDRNELTISVKCTNEVGGPWEEVAIEIRGPWFLRTVVVHKPENQSGMVTGQVVGPAATSMELYLLHYGRTLVFQRGVGSDPAGCNFTLTIPHPLPDGLYSPDFPAWRVELIEGANRWFTFDTSAANDRSQDRTG